jgi:hypothetical protein
LSHNKNFRYFFDDPVNIFGADFVDESRRADEEEVTSLGVMRVYRSVEHVVQQALLQLT